MPSALRRELACDGCRTRAEWDGHGLPAGWEYDEYDEDEELGMVWCDRCAGREI